MTTTTSKPTRVLVVDDSALYRQAICNVLREESEVEVVGVAKDGLDALEKILELDPDLLTLDVEMPDMDGIQVLREMNRRGMRPKAIMVSSHTSEGAKVTTDALLEGAFDYPARPHKFVDMETGEVLRLNPGDLKKHYSKITKDFFTEINLRCGQYNIDLVEADIRKDFKEVLLPFLIKRSKLY